MEYLHSLLKFASNMGASDVHIKASHHATIRISGEQDVEPPWAYNKIHLIYSLSGAGLDAAAAEQAIQLSEEKYCSVAATVSGKAAITWEYEIV